MLEEHFKMIETESLILDKAKYSDWKEMYCNVWSQPESAKYMEWNITTSEENAKIRIMKTIAFQKEHDTYLVHRFLIPHIPSTRYLHHCRVVVSQRCHRIASFLRLALMQISSTLYTRIKKTLY